MGGGGGVLNKLLKSSVRVELSFQRAPPPSRRTPPPAATENRWHLANAIAREWSVTPDQLSGSIPVGAALSVAGAMLAGRLSVRFEPWKTYIAWGWIMIVLLVALAFAPRSPSSFFTLLFLHRAGSGACYAALLGS